MSRILVWFSCGAASAVAAKVAVERYGKEADVEICYCASVEKDEHPDNARFLGDVERWTGREVKRLYHPKYKSLTEIYEGERYVAGVLGAVCTAQLKREVREAYQRPGDRHVIGYTHDERGRISDFEAMHPELNCLWLLACAGITKEDCYHVLSAAGIELPTMYTLGYNHNNCRGCCKGGMGYWNKIRVDFPDVFAERARVYGELGVKPFKRADGTRFGLDELQPDQGRFEDEPKIECGVFCSHYSKLMDLAATSPAPQPQAGSALALRTGAREPLT